MSRFVTHSFAALVAVTIALSSLAAITSVPLDTQVAVAAVPVLA